jgi:hypothetical protein
MTVTISFVHPGHFIEGDDSTTTPSVVAGGRRGRRL